MKNLKKFQTVSIVVFVLALLALQTWDVVTNYDSLPIWKCTVAIVLAALQIKWAHIVGRNAPSSKLEMIANIFTVPAMNAIVVGCASGFMISPTGFVVNIALITLFWSMFITMLCRVVDSKPEDGKLAMYGLVVFLGNICLMTLADLFGLEDAYSKLFAAVMILSIFSIVVGFVQGIWSSATR